MAITEPTARQLEEREMWARGDYGAIARSLFWPVGESLVSRAAVRTGERVLDVACGTGNAALRAAAAGGRVTGLDLTPELLAEGRRLAAETGVAIEWVEGDAEAMPFEDGAFEVVLSTFGCMFAPDHEAAATEIARVTAPGGRIWLASWTPASSIAACMRAMFRHAPPEPAGGEFRPPPLWGVEEHVRGLFAGTGIEIECEHDTVEFRHDSIEDALDTYETTWGPFMALREALEPDGRWAELRDELGAILAEYGEATPGGFAYPGEYLVVNGTRVGG